MGSIKFSTNAKRLSTDIKKRVTDYEKNISDEINRAGLNIESDAKLRLQEHESRKSFPSVRSEEAGNAKKVKQRITKEYGTPQDPSATVSSDELPIGAYLEFGTGIYAKKYLQGRPEAEKSKAREFYKTGKGTIRAFPYLFPSFDAERPKLIERLKRAKI